MSSFYFFSVLICCLTAQFVYNYDESTPFGPSNWPNLYPECGAGRQSPIDVNTQSDFELFENDDACEAGYFLDFDFSHTSFEIKNRGKTFFITPIDEQGTLLTTNTTVIGRLTNILLDEPAEYCFDSLHFHWGADNTEGSEHYLDGVQYPIEAHFVHFDCRYQNIQAAIDAQLTSGVNETENLAVIGVFYELSRDGNDAFDPIVDNVADFRDADEITTVEADFTGFFGSADNFDNFAQTVFLYKGSLTTPGCLRAVLWHVSDTVLTISQEQLDALYTVRYDEDGNFADLGTFGNFRPLQDLGQRTVYKLNCDDSDDSSDSSSSSSKGKSSSSTTTTSSSTSSD